MQLAHNFRRARRGAVTAFLGGALIVVALGLSQCRMVNEQLTGVAVGPARATNCLNTCAMVWNDSVRVENQLHVDNVHFCTGDSECLALENARYDIVEARLEAGRLACQDDCHHQGGGEGGSTR